MDDELQNAENAIAGSDRQLHVDTANHAHEMLLTLGFRYCVLSKGAERVNQSSCRTWMSQTCRTCKEGDFPWEKVLGSNFKPQNGEMWSTRDVIRRMKGTSAESLGDFIVFFQWVLSNAHPMAVVSREKLRTNHPELPTYEAAIAASAASPFDCPRFPADAKSARSYASTILKNRRATKRYGAQDRCVNEFIRSCCRTHCWCFAKSHPDMSKVTLDDSKGSAVTVFGSKIKTVMDMKYPHDFRRLFIWHHMASPGMTDLPVAVVTPTNAQCRCWCCRFKCRSAGKGVQGPSR